MMNGVDAVLAVVLGLCALRGYWRGFLRECFGFIALVAGIGAALRFTAEAEVVVQEHLTLPAPVQAGLAFVAIFVIVHTTMNGIGFMLNRLAGTAVLRGINGVAGAAFGAGKGAAVLAFLLLFIHLFPSAPALESYVMTSAFGRPLVAGAGAALRLGLQGVGRPVGPNRA